MYFMYATEGVFIGVILYILYKGEGSHDFKSDFTEYDRRAKGDIAR